MRERERERERKGERERERKIIRCWILIHVRWMYDPRATPAATADKTNA
jgi:hypothetical protein